MRRVAESRSPRQAQMYRWPKNQGGYRLMTWIDPLDLILYRCLVGRLVNQMYTVLDREHVLAARLVSGPPGWQLARHGGAVRERSEKALAALRVPGQAVLGVFDVKDYFKQISRNLLCSQLRVIPGPKRSTQYLLDWLRLLETDFGVKGLPVGCDASSVIGNYLLVTADQLFAELGVTYLRYMDDTWSFVASPQRYENLLARYSHELGTLGLEPNLAKCDFYVSLSAQEAIRSSLNEYLDDELREASETGATAARDLFSAAMVEPFKLQREFRRAISRLTVHRCTDAVSVLRAQPDLLRVAPYQWGKYLPTLVSDPTVRSKLDVDWILEEAVGPVEQNDVAWRVTFLRAAAAMQAPKGAGQRLLDRAMDHRSPTPVRVIAAHAWGRAEGWKPKRAVEAAEIVGDYSARRALTATLAARRGDRKMASWIRRLRSAEPDLAPTLRWLESN